MSAAGRSTRLTVEKLTAAVGRGRRPLAELDGELEPLVVPEDRQTGRLPGQEPFRDGADDVLGRLHRDAVDRDDHVAAWTERNPRELLLRAAALDPDLGGRAAGDDSLDGRAFVYGVAEVLRETRGQGLGRDAEPGIAHLSALDQLLHRAARGVDRHREADPLGVAGVAVDLRVDADHAPASVEHGAAGVPAVDRCVGLDRVDEVVARGQGGDGALRRRDDADAQRALVPEWAADRRYGLADNDVGGVAEGDDGQVMIGRPNLQKADIVVDVPADDARLGAVAVPELDEDGARRLGRRGRIAFAGRRDHMGVREDVAVGGDDEAGALRRVGGREAVVRPEERNERDHARGALAVDLSWVEIVARKRLRFGVLVDRIVRRGRRARGRENDGLRRAPGADPP